HRVARNIDLQRPRVVGARNELHHLWIRRSGDIDDRPPGVPEMPQIEIPPAAGLADRDLEARPAVQIAVADGLEVTCEGSRWDRIRGCGPGEEGDARREDTQSVSER